MERSIGASRGGAGRTGGGSSEGRPATVQEMMSQQEALFREMTRRMEEQQEQMQRSLSQYREQDRREVELTSRSRDRLEPDALSQIPEFSGKQGEDANEWIEEVVSVAAAYGWGPELKRRGAVGKLRGAAKDWQRNEGDGLTEWTIWRERLCRAFGRTMTLGRWVQMVAERVQQPGESIMEYSHAKQRLCHRAPQAIEVEEVIRRLILGLSNPAYRAALSAIRPRTLEEYYIRIRELDELEQEMLVSESWAAARTSESSHPRESGAGSRVAGGVERGETATPLRASGGSRDGPHLPAVSRPRVTASTGRSSSEWGAVPQATRSFGEVVDGRYTARAERPPEGSRSDDREEWLRSRTCYQCGRRGHLARDCPERSHAAPASASESRTPVQGN